MMPQRQLLRKHTLWKRSSKRENGTSSKIFTSFCNRKVEQQETLLTLTLYLSATDCTKLRDIEDDTEKQTTSAALSLLAHLVYFKELNSGASKNLAKSHDFPKIIHQKCKSLFCDPESEGISVEKTNLLISYVLVLTLHVDKFKMDPEDITNDLRMRTGGLRNHYEQLGCKFVREKSSLVATLPVPLSSSLLRVCRRGRNDRWRETKGVVMILKKICYILPVLEIFFGLMTHKLHLFLNVHRP